MTVSPAEAILAPENTGLESVQVLLKRHSLPTLARFAGLRSGQSLEQLMSLPRYRGRLAQFLQRAAANPQSSGAADVRPQPRYTAPALDRVFQSVGLCWGLARLPGALTPEDMTTLRASFAPDVLAMAEEGLTQLRVAPALTAPSGVTWLTPDYCRSFGQAVCLGWLDAKQPDGLVQVADVLGLDVTGCDIRRIEALDTLVEAFMRQQEEAQ